MIMTIPSVWNSSRVASRARSYPVLSLIGELDRLFDDVLPSTQSERSTFAPKLDIKESDKEFIVTGEFPGMAEKDIQIELNENTLTLSGEKRQEQEKKEGERTYYERSFGSFSRRIPFNVEIDEDNTKAAMKNGVLTITIPKSEKVIRGAKKVSISSN